MKKFILSFLLCSLPIFAHADDTNFSNADACYQAMIKYGDDAIDQKLPNLSAWFSSFATDVGATFDYSNNRVTFYEGCNYLGSDGTGEKLWLRIQSKLNQQISQLKAGQESLFGTRAILVCHFDTAHRTIDFNSCQ